MPRIRMTCTKPGSLDGRTCIDYQEGQEYDLPDQGPEGLAAVFLREGWAELVEVPVVAADPVRQAAVESLHDRITALVDELREEQDLREHAEDRANRLEAENAALRARVATLEAQTENRPPVTDDHGDKRCQATTKSGTPCKGRPLPGSPFCVSHQPES